MENKTFVIGALLLLVGVLIGYGVGGRMSAPVVVEHQMNVTMDGMMSALEGKTGDALDEVFLKEMIVHHQGAVAMAEMLLKHTTRPELQKMANDIISAQTTEIKMMQDWQKEWFGK